MSPHSGAMMRVRTASERVCRGVRAKERCCGILSRTMSSVCRKIGRKEIERAENATENNEEL